MRKVKLDYNLPGWYWSVVQTQLQCGFWAGIRTPPKGLRLQRTHVKRSPNGPNAPGNLRKGGNGYGKRRLGKNGIGSWRGCTGSFGWKAGKIQADEKSPGQEHGRCPAGAKMRFWKHCLQAQADDIVAAAKEENKKIEEAEAAAEAAEAAQTPVIEDAAK